MHLVDYEMKRDFSFVEGYIQWHKCCQVKLFNNADLFLRFELRINRLNSYFHGFSREWCKQTVVLKVSHRFNTSTLSDQFNHALNQNSALNDLQYNFV